MYLKTACPTTPMTLEKYPKTLPINPKVIFKSVIMQKKTEAAKDKQQKTWGNNNINKKVCGSRSWPHSLCTHRYLNLNSDPLKITSHVSFALEITGIPNFSKISQTHYIFVSFVHRNYSKTLELTLDLETDVYTRTDFFVSENFANQKIWREKKLQFSYIIFFFSGFFFSQKLQLFTKLKYCTKITLIFFLNIGISNWKTTWIWIWNPRFYF